ncbi:MULTISPECIES: hypothetical protein [unclassified Streptomyces]|uniref:hypothetical protein n=1 Tax=unclassified Streptomyces TaxID=2593676 RepID=UPI00035D9B68|nr:MULTISPECIES: hypothetical protein [unclassified Streptomyces]MYQ75971.1 hypothetical protein [Streptomyces sp. SID4923]
MRPVLPTLARLVAALGLALAGLGATASPVAADPQPMGRCTTTSGAVLAVDFSHWGGPIYRACGTTPTTGYELLNQGGWRTVGTGHDGPAFICRIGFSGYKSGKQFPPTSEEDCVLTPPASAYWSYWHANPGANDWEYSQLGAMLYRPKPGSVDLWIFGGTDIGGTKGRPKVTPDQLRAHNTKPTGAGSPASTEKAPELPPDVDTGPAPEQGATQENPPTPTHSKKPKASKKPEKSEPPSPSPSPTPSPSETPTPSDSPSADAAAAKGKTPVLDAEPTADAPHDSGSVLPVVAGAALVVLIGSAAFYAARRRRHE